MDNLKPCPFCGKEAKLHRDSWPTDDKGGKAVAFWVKCAPCGSSSGEFKSREKAIAAWNKRAAPTSGEWIPVPSSDMMTGKAYKCSRCGKIRYGSFMPNFCGNCGAKMTNERG